MRLRMLVPVVAVALAATLSAGCVQVIKFVSIGLGNLSAVNGAASAGKYIDLAAENKTYADNKDKFSDVDDIAVLGTFKNNTGTAVSADVWMVRAPSSPALLANLAAVQAAGGIKISSVTLGPNETKTPGWDAASSFITPAGKTALHDELAGDAIFTLYVFGSTGTYDITVSNASVAVMIGVDLGP